MTIFFLILLAIYLIPVILIRYIAFYIYDGLIIQDYFVKSFEMTREYVHKDSFFYASFVPLLNYLLCLILFFTEFLPFLKNYKVYKENFFIFKLIASILKQISSFFTHKSKV